MDENARCEIYQLLSIMFQTVEIVWKLFNIISLGKTFVKCKCESCGSPTLVLKTIFRLFIPLIWDLFSLFWSPFCHTTLTMTFSYLT